MFEFISEKLGSALSGLWKSSSVTEEQIDEALKSVRMALLEADVNFSVVKTFNQRLRDRLKENPIEKLSGVTPVQQVIKLIHDEIVNLLGGKSETATAESPEKWKEKLAFNPETLSLHKAFTSILVCGLQGSGKTTQVGKLARLIRKQMPNKRVLVAACDLQRPQAVEQLDILCKQAGVDLYRGSGTPPEVAKAAYKMAKEQYDVLITDTAGRLYIDEPLMNELHSVREQVSPDEVLFVASAAMGQDVAKSAQSFHERMALTGSIVTMLDGDAKGGAVLSIHMMTGRPIKLEGVGEKLDDLQPFHAHSMADRLLGMGDTINLVRKMQEHVNENDSKDLEKKILSATFTFDDFLKQLQTLKRMGSLTSLLKMIPGASQLPVDEKKMAQTEAMILSMTPAERNQKVELVVSRRKRIARGAGVRLEEVHQMVKTFQQMKDLAKNLPNLKQQMKKSLGGFSWR
jgi:signal recognition particle subunit SRP54